MACSSFQYISLAGTDFHLVAVAIFARSLVPVTNMDFVLSVLRVLEYFDIL